jgi:hypothetical protein
MKLKKNQVIVLIPKEVAFTQYSTSVDNRHAGMKSRLEEEEEEGSLADRRFHRR